MSTVFTVQNAGCPSCAETIRAAIEPLAEVASVVIDEDADTATVRLAGSLGVTQREVENVLTAASAGTGHSYRLNAESWQSE